MAHIPRLGCARAQPDAAWKLSLCGERVSPCVEGGAGKSLVRAQPRASLGRRARPSERSRRVAALRFRRIAIARRSQFGDRGVVHARARTHGRHRRSEKSLGHCDEARRLARARSSHAMDRSRRAAHARSHARAGRRSRDPRGRRRAHALCAWSVRKIRESVTPLDPCRAGLGALARARSLAAHGATTCARSHASP